MKTGKSLVELATELERRANNKTDYLAKTDLISMSRDEAEALEGDFDRLLKLNVGDIKVGINGLAHDQLGSYCDIPAAYYDRCRTHDPDLLIHNVNSWIAKAHETRMVRTLDGKARAFLSNAYRPLENEDLANAILPILLDGGEYDIHSCDVTEKRLYIKVVGKSLTRELAKHGATLGSGHTIVHVMFPAITVSNSEVGCGALSIQRGLYDSGCSNLGTYGEKALRRAHVGGRHELVSDELVSKLSDDTRRKMDSALWSQVRDVIKLGFAEGEFNALCDKVEGAQADRIEKDADVVKVVKVAGQKLGLREGEQKGVLQCLIEGGDLSRCGLHNAITKFSQEDALSYDRATELERIGAQVIELPKNDWNVIARAN